MSVKKTLSVNSSKSTKSNGQVDAKSKRFGRWFSSRELIINIEPGTKSLKDLDSSKLKADIKRWAKAVVAFARQVSNRFGSSRRRNISGRIGSSQELHGDDDDE